MIKVIKNGLVITMDEKRDKKFEKLDIVIEDNIIKEIVENYKGEYDEIIDACDKIVMPGLINCHTHLGMSIFRATNDNLNLNDWLNKKIWPIENNMNDDDVYYATMLSCLEMIESGTTCSNDMYFGSLRAIDAIKQTKVRSVFSRCLMDSDNKGDEKIEEFKKLYENNKNNDLIKFAITPHSLYTCSKDYLKKCSDLGLEYNIPVHIHFSENESEVKDIKKKYHKDPVLALEKLGFLRNKLILAHGTFISDKGLNLLKDKDVSICHNPISNLNLGCGIADIVKYKKNLNICLGTDGQGSGNNMNLFYHMSVVDLLQKGKYQNPTVMSSYDVLKMATINGAKAMGLKNNGLLKEGFIADIIEIDLNRPNMQPINNIINNIVFSGSKDNIAMTMINGKILYADRNFYVGQDVKQIYQDCQEVTDRIEKEYHERNGGN